MLRMSFLQIVFWATVLPLFLFALRFGGREEKLGISLIIGGSVATALLSPNEWFTFSDMPLSIFLADLFVLIAFVKLSFSSQKYWPLWVASLQLITVMTHVVELAIPDVVPKAYAIIQGFWVYPMCVAIAAGTYGHMVETRRQGLQESL
jgi:hypothetical protein